LDEISKLWTGFQAKFRLSVAYQVAVVLIESKHAVRTPLPVLTRGDVHDKGVLVQPGLIPPYPTLETVAFPDNRTGALLGDELALTGHHLTGDSVIMRFSHPLLEDPIPVPVTPGNHTPTRITVTIPGDPVKWPAGFYKVAALITRTGEQDRTTNEIPLTLGPRISTFTKALPPPPPFGTYKVSVTCSPKVRLEQKAVLLLGDREFPAQPPPAPPPPPAPEPTHYDELIFNLTEVPDGDYFRRLRVDGVDSPLIDRSVTPPVFDMTQKVTFP